MHAALITGPGKLEVRDFADPTPADGGVVVDITYCGVCGTDVHAFTSGRTYTPAICGHEWTGIVSAVGRSVSTIVEGDRVVVGVPAACGSCVACEAGHPAQCMTVASFARGRDADAPPARRLRTAHRRERRPGDRRPPRPRRRDACPGRAGDGLGPRRQPEPDRRRRPRSDPGSRSGRYHHHAVRHSLRARSAIIVEPNAARRAVAASLGATGVTPDGAAELIAELTGGLGADVVFECSGVTRAVGDAVGLRPDGWVGLPRRSRRWAGVDRSGRVAPQGDHRHHGARLCARRVRHRHATPRRRQGARRCIAHLDDPARRTRRRCSTILRAGQRRR